MECLLKSVIHLRATRCPYVSCHLVSGGDSLWTELGKTEVCSLDTTFGLPREARLVPLLVLGDEEGQHWKTSRDLRGCYFVKDIYVAHSVSIMDRLPSIFC